MPSKVELCFTPTNASWANPIEARFAKLHRYPRRRNANACHPDVLAAQRRERARVRSEKGIRWGGGPRSIAP